MDKTRHIFKMVDEGMYYFMSRPRRFGKSLMVSTLRSLFQGKKDLFKGLWIAENTDWEWKEHPVISIDFNVVSHDTTEDLKRGLESRLKRNARVYGIQLNESLLREQFEELILALNEKTGMPVVILVDEYDKPLIDHLGRGKEALDIAKANRDVLKSFFGVIKGGDVDSVLKFVFLTGVSKFSRVSIFSELNNLEDLTMAASCADVFGYTHEELKTYFKPHIAALGEALGLSEADTVKKLTEYYDGYRFSKKDVRVYNPFSILNALKQKDLENFWFETGTPTFLVSLLRERNYPLPEIENMEADKETFSTWDIEDLKPEAVLFQTGYVTIKDVEDDFIYTFTYPNREVKLAFQKHLLFSYLGDTVKYSKALRISFYLRKEKLDAFIETMTAVFASVPYPLEAKRDEAYFHTIFYLTVSGYGVHADSEVLTNEGRIDMVAEFADKVYIIEFKCNQSAEKALKQIRDKNYAQKYRQGGKKIILLGINFDTEKRNITDWEISEQLFSEQCCPAIPYEKTVTMKSLKNLKKRGKVKAYCFYK